VIAPFDTQLNLFHSCTALGGLGHVTVEISRGHSVRHNIFGRITLDEWSARSRILYLTMHNTQKRQTFMSRWNSSHQFQQSSGRKLTTQTTRPSIKSISCKSASTNQISEHARDPSIGFQEGRPFDEGFHFFPRSNSDLKLCPWNRIFHITILSYSMLNY